MLGEPSRGRRFAGWYCLRCSTLEVPLWAVCGCGGVCVYVGQEGMVGAKGVTAIRKALQNKIQRLQRRLESGWGRTEAVGSQWILSLEGRGGGGGGFNQLQAHAWGGGGWGMGSTAIPICKRNVQVVGKSDMSIPLRAQRPRQHNRRRCFRHCQCCYYCSRKGGEGRTWGTCWTKTGRKRHQWALPVLLFKL